MRLDVNSVRGVREEREVKEDSNFPILFQSPGLKHLYSFSIFSHDNFNFLLEAGSKVISENERRGGRK